jgi:hypothetical protein
VRSSVAIRAAPYELALVAAEAVRCVTARIAFHRELGREPFSDALPVKAEPGLSGLGSVDELVPGSLVGAQDLLVAEPDDDTDGVETVLEQIERGLRGGQGGVKRGSVQMYGKSNGKTVESSSTGAEESVHRLLRAEIRRRWSSLRAAGRVW